MLKKIAIAATLAILSSAAVAADAPSIYAGVDLGKTKIDGFKDRETSYGAFVGYNFNRNWAIEGGYRSLAEFEYSGVNVDAKQVHLSAVATLPLSNNFNVFGRLGYNRITAKGTFLGTTYKESDSKPLFGVGVGYEFTPTAQVRFEIQRPESDTTNASVGLAFKF